MENVLLATLPPFNEMDEQLHTQLMIAMENRASVNDDFINEVLPSCVDVIKIAWYKSLKVPRQVFSVAETPSHVSL